MFNLGLMYEKRRGVSPNAAEADLLEATRECYESAAESGVTKAMVCACLVELPLPCESIRPNLDMFLFAWPRPPLWCRSPFKILHPFRALSPPLSLSLSGWCSFHACVETQRSRRQHHDMEA